MTRQHLVLTQDQGQRHMGLPVQRWEAWLQMTRQLSPSDSQDQGQRHMGCPGGRHALAIHINQSCSFLTNHNPDLLIIGLIQVVMKKWESDSSEDNTIQTVNGLYINII